MHFSSPFSTIAALLLLTVPPSQALPKDCLPCAALCAYDAEWCAQSKCFTEGRGGFNITAICGLRTGDENMNRARAVDLPVSRVRPSLTLIEGTRLPERTASERFEHKVGR